MTHFINNRWIKGSGLNLISRNPATSEMLWSGHSAGQEEVQEAIEAARAAFKPWSRLAIKQRIEVLQQFKKNLNGGLAEYISQDTGKPLWEAESEIKAMINKVDISIDAYHERCPEKLIGGIRLSHKPHGVVAVFGPFNFPGHLPNGHIIPALLAGNTVIFKPSEQTPWVAEKMLECWEQTDLPPGVLNMLQGGRETGRLLAEHPELDGLFFTGSYETGQIFSDQFGKHPEKILALEMGGNNPLLIGKIDNLKSASEVIIQSAFITSGQRCSCARRLIVPIGDKGDQLLATLIDQTRELKVGAYTDSPEPFMGPVISEHAATHLLTVQASLQNQGGQSLLEMYHLKRDTSFVSPGIIDVTNCPRRADIEFFGPLLQVIRTQNFEEGLKEANQTSFGLTAGLLSNDPAEFEQFYQEIRAGVINWNRPTTGASSSFPFGGVGKSGNHRPSGFYAADYCSYPVVSSMQDIL